MATEEIDQIQQNKQCFNEKMISETLDGMYARI